MQPFLWKKVSARMLVSMSDSGGGTERITLATLQACKEAGRKFSVLTCYDAPTARLMASAGVEILLVGDTAGEVVLGLPRTREVPIEFMVHITAAVRRGAPNAFVMADLPYQCTVDGPAKTVEWCRRFRDETGCDGIKIEVTAAQADLVSAVRDADIAVVAHLGLLPQSIESPSGYRAQGRDAAGAQRLLTETRQIEEAGASMLLLEAVASEAAGEITARTKLPVIGCVSGPRCDGTVVVLHDMLGLGGGHPPRAVKRYENLSELMTRAFRAYVEDIHAGRFPTDEQAIHMHAGEHEKLVGVSGAKR